MNKISIVGRVDNVLTDVTSTISVGDNVQFTPTVNAISVLREKAVFFENEFLFSDYPIFSRPFSELASPEPVKMTTVNECPVIQVENINVFRIVASSLLQIGSSERMRSERRVKHIRHLLRSPQ